MHIRHPWYRASAGTASDPFATTSFGVVRFAATFGWCAILWLCLSPTPVQANGLYERMDGDLVLTAGLGAGMTTRDRNLLGVGEFEALYLDSAGTMLSLEHVDGTTGLAWGVKLRPLFLARFFGGAWTGSSFLDLLIDSWGFEVGSWIGPFADGTGAALLLGTSAEIPLGTRRRGFHLRLAARYVHAPSDYLGAPPQLPHGFRVVAALVYAGILDTGMTAPK